MVKLKRYVVTLPLLLCVLLATGCPSERYVRAAQAAKDFSVAVKTFQAAEIQAYGDGYVDTEEHILINRILYDVAQSGKKLDSAINVAHSQPGTVAALQELTVTLEALNNEGVLHIKNPSKRAELQASLIVAKGLLATIQGILEAK